MPALIGKSHFAITSELPILHRRHKITIDVYRPPIGICAPRWSCLKDKFPVQRFLYLNAARDDFRRECYFSARLLIYDILFALAIRPVCIRNRTKCKSFFQPARPMQRIFRIALRIKNLANAIIFPIKKRIAITLLEYIAGKLLRHGIIKRKRLKRSLAKHFQRKKIHSVEPQFAAPIKAEHPALPATRQFHCLGAFFLHFELRPFNLPAIQAKLGRFDENILAARSDTHRKRRVFEKVFALQHAPASPFAASYRNPRRRHRTVKTDLALKRSKVRNNKAFPAFDALKLRLYKIFALLQSVNRQSSIHRRIGTCHLATVCYFAIIG